MSKIATMQKETSAPSVALVSGNPALTALFAGRTLHQVGSLNDLDDSDVTIAKTGPDNIPNLCVTIDGVKHLIPFSYGFPMEKLNDADWFLRCEFRSTFKSFKQADGVTPAVDDEGNIQLDESKPYLSFGKPSGITINSETAAFGAVTADVKAGGAKSATATRGKR